jgi:hypothetical protein
MNSNQKITQIRALSRLQIKAQAKRNSFRKRVSSLKSIHFRRMKLKGSRVLRRSRTVRHYLKRFTWRALYSINRL